jgi:hypothetical protein
MKLARWRSICADSGGGKKKDTMILESIVLMKLSVVLC